MPRLEVLKSYPIAGERLIAAEIAAPLLVISILEMLFATSASIMIGMGEANKFDAICGHAAVHRGRAAAHDSRLRGAAPDPQRHPRALSGVGDAQQRRAARIRDDGTAASSRWPATCSSSAVALIPAAIVFLPSLWIAYKFFSGNAAFVAVATMPAVGVIVAEVWFGVKALGAQFETLDISNESRHVRSVVTRELHSAVRQE